MKILLASTDEGNKETYDEEDCSVILIKDDEREFLEIDTGFGESDAINDSDDFGMEDNFDVNTEDSAQGPSR